MTTRVSQFMGGLGIDARNKLTVHANSTVVLGTTGASGTSNLFVGKAVVAGLTFPTSDGSSGQFLKTDGAGTLSFSTVDTNLVSDTSPQLGGNLDLNDKNITGQGIIELTAGNTYDPAGGSGTDTSTNVGLALAGGGRIVFSSVGFIRNMISSAPSSTIDIGQDGTGLITGINIKPGTSGSVKLFHSTNEILTTISSGVRIDGNANVSSNVIVGNNIVFEGHTDDGNQTTLHAIDPTGNRVIVLPDSSGTLALTTDIAAGTVTESGTQTLTNKSLTAPILTGSSSAAGSIIFKEDTDNGTNAVTLIGPAATADVTVTLPAATDTLVGKATTDTLTNKTLTVPTINAPVMTIPDISGGANLKNGSTSAGFLKFFEDSDNGTNAVTLIGPASTADVTLTLPSATDTLVGKTTTDTLTNKTLTTPTLTTPVINNGADIKNGATSAGFIKFFEDSDNGTNAVTLQGPASTGDVTLTLPAHAGTIVAANANGTIAFANAEITSVISAALFSGDGGGLSNVTVSGTAADSLLSSDTDCGTLTSANTTSSTDAFGQALSQIDVADCLDSPPNSLGTVDNGALS